ncbi:MAG: AraC family transcriptional regulator ligand-binding domain-containing protein [Pseudolabrys sp.]
MSQSALKKIAALRRCGGLLSRLAYECGRKEGVDVEVLLRQAHLTPREIKSKDIPLSVQNQIKFVDLVANATGDPLLGIRLAYSYDLREIGLLYYVIASAENFLGSLLRVARYSDVANEGVDLEVKKGDLLRVRLHYSGVARHSDVHQIEFWMASLVRICRKVIGTNLKPIEVRIVHNRIKQVSEMEKLLRCAVKTGADVDEIVFSRENADYPVVTADPYLERLCVRLCEETLARLGKRTSPLRVRVENVVATLLPHGEMNFDAVATELGLSGRTLSRKLALEGHSFSRILDDLRLALARRYLAESDMPISEIAWLLGYSEIANFTHAFHRWTGTNPRTERAKVRRSLKFNASKSSLTNSTTSDKKSRVPLTA